MRSLIYECLNEPDKRQPITIVVSVFLVLAIVLNIIQVVLVSDAEFALWMANWHKLSVATFTFIFGLEYLMRVWSAVETPHDVEQSAWKKRFAYILSPMGIIDLLSFLPALLWLLLPEQFATDLRMLKLISMVRILKLTRYSASLSMLSKVLTDNKHTLVASAMVMLILMLVSATGIYVFEHKIQPDHFGSIPASMWWSVVTLTTVGYGDVIPLSFAGKAFGALVMVCGVGIAAMPAGIFASSFVQLVREQEHERKRHINHNDKSVLQVALSASEEREIDYLMKEYGLSLDQALGVVKHFRRVARLN